MAGRLPNRIVQMSAFIYTFMAVPLLHVASKFDSADEEDLNLASGHVICAFDRMSVSTSR